MPYKTPELSLSGSPRLNQFQRTGTLLLHFHKDG
jgi:hypothetical protein